MCTMHKITRAAGASCRPHYCVFLISLPSPLSDSWGIFPPHLGNGHPVSVIDMRGCGTLAECVVAGVGEVVAVGISTVAVRQGFCKKRGKG